MQMDLATIQRAGFFDEGHDRRGGEHVRSSEAATPTERRLRAGQLPTERQRTGTSTT